MDCGIIYATDAFSAGLTVDIRKKMGNFRLEVQFEAENETLALRQAGAGGDPQSRHPGPPYHRGRPAVAQCLLLRGDTGHTGRICRHCATAAGTAYSGENLNRPCIFLQNIV